MTTTTDDRLQAARAAADRHDWREAYDLLTALDADGSSSGAMLELLAEMAWWVPEPDVAVRTRERAHAAYMAEGDRARGAYMALLAAQDHHDHQAHAIAAGWSARAVRILESEPECFAHGFLAVFESMGASGSGDLVRAQELGARAVEIGEQCGNKDLQALGLVCQGYALSHAGDFARGLRLLDEATAAAVAGELTPYVTGVVYCQTISTCRDLSDYRRAGQWTQVAEQWCERQSINGFPGVCRVHRAEILALTGDWPRAETEARRASEELMSFKATGRAADGYYTLGEIRLRMGDLPGADEAFRMAQDLGREPQPGRALYYLAQGRVDAAAAAIQRALSGTTDPVVRSRMLPVQVDIAIAAGALEIARAAADELERIAADFGTVALHATAHCARGSVLVAAGDPDGALSELSQARDHWRSLEAPYEMARTRSTLAAALQLRGETEEATLEGEAAHASFMRLGALLDATRCAQLLERIRVQTTRGVRQRRTFMFTDIVGSTELIGVIGDDGWHDVKRWHDQALRGVVAEHHGEEINEAGDGFFFAFADVGDAVDSAIAIQRALADHRRAAGFAPRVRIGIHAADATRAGDGYIGQGVHQAARIGGLAGPGEIIASAATLEGEVIAGLGPTRSAELKGIAEPVEVRTIDWTATASG